MGAAETKKGAVKQPTSLWDILGEAVRKVPPSYWEERMMFGGASDRELLRQTSFFPERRRHSLGTHPIYVLRITGSDGIEVCPCSTKGRMAVRFIRQGCRLEGTGKVLNRRSYLIEAFRFLLPQDPAFWKPLRFWGKVPETCLESVSAP
ncbi:hypothetical protein [Desulfosoma caldarium]|uniref:Uncharacterized protein n=1 Tax=Desulfosoma caldarium TaxID=610254 RepID=A0A3N1URR3_9BACT|nr:hypothetical protein [Desulfosoma caldarium]ROQ92069.1 hypothetical protein EDC27_1741 [Desulfosoma caldarium]